MTANKPVPPILPPQASTGSLPRKRFTRTEVDRLLDIGFFDGQRYELIDGDLIEKMGQSPPHAFAIRLGMSWLAGFLGIRRILVQMPVETTGEDREWNVPEPDLAVLVEPKREYQERHPRGDELLLAIEIADGSAAFDLSRKATLYATSGVPEYWVLDLNRRQLVVYRQPDGTQYRRIQIYAADDVVSMEGRAETIRVGAILPDSN